MVFRCGICLCGLLLLTAGLLAQPVPVEELAQELDLPVIRLRSPDHNSGTTFEGSFFRYLPPVPGRSNFGVLHPKQDQSYSQPTQARGFWPQIRDGKVVEDVAASVRDKVRQMQRQTAIRGPQIYGLGVMENSEDDYDLVLPVEHVTGIKIPKDPTLRDAAMSEAFFGLLVDVVSEGQVLLDYNYTNAVVNPETGELRPVDVVLTTAKELEEEVGKGSRLGKLRLLQLAHTTVEINRASTDTTPLGYVCRSIIKELRARFPQVEQYESIAKKALNLP